MKSAAPERGASRGATSCSHMRCISCGTPGMATMMRPSRSAHQPGAVPTGLASVVTEGSTHACFVLLAGITTPRLANQARSRSR